MHKHLTILASLCLATPLAAQEVCGLPDASAQWIGGSQDNSDIATAEAHREQLALVLGETAYIAMFSLSQDSAVRIEAAGRGAGDPLFDVLAADGTVIVSDDDSGGNGAARSEVDLAAGTYCVSMTSYENAPMSAFVRIGRQEHEALTEGVTESDPEAASAVACDQAQPFGAIGGTQIASADQTGAWSFRLDAPTALTITAANEDADPTLALFDAGADLISENDDSDGLNSRIESAEPLPAGDYCIKVGAVTDATLPITVSIAEYDAQAALAAVYARGEAAPPLDGTVEFTPLGPLQTRMRQDITLRADTTWFTVDIPQSGLMLVEVIGLSESTDPWLVIFDDVGREVEINDDYASGSLDSKIAARVQAGTYIVGTKKIDDEADGFARLLLERFVPAD